jgi:transglycosylase-like protein with SLT domain
VGGGLVAVCAAIVVTVAALSGAHDGTAHGDTRGTPVAEANPVAGASTATAPTSAAPASTAPALASTAPAATPSAAGSTASSAPASSLSGATPSHLIVPDVIASVPGGLTAADLARIAKLAGVRAVLAIDGAQIKVNGTRLTVLAAPAAALRAWLPPATAASARVWSAFDAGDLITTAQSAASVRLVSGRGYPVAAAVAARITDGGTALLGITGVDGVVSQAEGKKLGLVRNVAVLVNAPAADLITLTGQVKAALGAGAQVVRLVSATVSTDLPVVAAVPAGRPSNYLQLFQESAARYCPGLSWTVLAAIGQIESGDGQNEGPSTAGAMGPMQFLPSTWVLWGTDGFGDTGKPDILNPFDAVPSAARLLCGAGAASGGSGLRTAIFAYNHADWYVDEVLTLAAEYAREY